ncbi:class I mannose-6-phosphate isomerase [Blastopirellula sp. JC732]|uniref:Phosphohexomutase n=1 Tax=Blastopirellula sediminis TaxID=2894196 RepID=A0A9X1MS59_9BACT|nr:type I phosphomannose isomerase catalytic subunit [Blastopirellula sediminis]MCC9605230.1 class I mannose-6-phosphate isomerase [Blastopirellula sediminis]MCC9631470.1 class I mannose-6-phosphate isomerase [Blastopirellula sediminis]
MTLDYPLRFVPKFRQYIWGGRRLGTELGKPIGEEGVFAESWEVVDHGEDQSVVSHGPLQGKTLGELVALFGEQLFGRRPVPPQFPLLFKFLDANTDLSIQVHPDDQQGALLDPPDLGKTEAWVIMDAEPGARMFVGLKEGVDRTALAKATAENRVIELMHIIEPQPGDCVYIPARTVHALGKGLLVAEIQQSSNTTYRLFDWNRRDAAGNSRPLHIEQSLETIDFAKGPVALQTPQVVEPGVERLVECDKFVLDRLLIAEPHSVGGDERFHILSVLSGSVAVQHPTHPLQLRKGETILLPAASAAVTLVPDGQTTLLDMYLP